MRAVVTGATGYLGGALVDHLLARGDQVLGVHRGAAPPARPGLSWLAARPGEETAAAVLDARPDVLFHLAWCATPGRYLVDPENLDHLEAGVHLARRLRGSGIRLVGTGTCIEYDLRGVSGPVDEDRALAPTTLYGACKAALGLALAALAAAGSLRATWARVFYPWGGRADPRRLLPTVHRTLAAGGTFALRAPPQTTRDFVHVDDVATALLACADAPEPPPAVNVGTGTGVRLDVLVRHIAAGLSAEERVRLDPAATSDEPPVIVADSRRLRALGWAPRHDLLAEAGEAAP